MTNYLFLRVGWGGKGRRRRRWWVMMIFTCLPKFRKPTKSKPLLGKLSKSTLYFYLVVLLFLFLFCFKVAVGVCVCFYFIYRSRPSLNKVSKVLVYQRVVFERINIASMKKTFFFEGRKQIMFKMFNVKSLFCLLVY